MEKCTFCVQRIRRGELDADREGRQLRDGDIQPACAQACPTDAMVFGDISDSNSRVSELAKNKRKFHLREELGTETNVIYLAQGDAEAQDHSHA